MYCVKCGNKLTTEDNVCLHCEHKKENTSDDMESSFISQKESTTQIFQHAKKVMKNPLEHIQKLTEIDVKVGILSLVITNVFLCFSMFVFLKSIFENIVSLFNFFPIPGAEMLGSEMISNSLLSKSFTLLIIQLLILLITNGIFYFLLRNAYEKIPFLHLLAINGILTSPGIILSIFLFITALVQAYEIFLLICFFMFILNCLSTAFMTIRFKEFLKINPMYGGAFILFIQVVLYRFLLEGLM